MRDALDTLCWFALLFVTWLRVFLWAYYYGEGEDDETL